MEKKIIAVYRATGQQEIGVSDAQLKKGIVYLRSNRIN